MPDRTVKRRLQDSTGGPFTRGERLIASRCMRDMDMEHFERRSARQALRLLDREKPSAALESAWIGFLKGQHEMKTENAKEFPELSLMEGGPGDALMKRLRLIRPEFGAASARTAIILSAITWLPLLAFFGWRAFSCWRPIAARTGNRSQ